MDYAAVEGALGEAAARAEQEGHQAVLQALDVNRETLENRRDAVSARGPRVGDVLHDGKPGGGGAVAVPRGWAAECESRRRGEPAIGSGGRRMAPAHGASDGARGTEGKSREAEASARETC
jgi:hypothetical protein